MKRKRRGPNGPPTAALVQMMTISLFIILLAFFIMLNAIALVDTEKEQAVVGAVNSSFGGKAREEGELGDAANAFYDEGLSPVAFRDLVTGEPGRDITVSVARNRTTFRIPMDLIFDGVGMGVTARGRALLDKLAGVLAKNSYEVEIAGHTDNVPPGPGVATNREFSSLRSIKVLRYLVEKAGVDPSRLTALGWGASRPFFSNRTVESRRLNRRIDVAFVHDGPVGKEESIFIFKDFFFKVEE